MTFIIEALDPATADRLRADAHIVRVADAAPGYPCRQCLRDADIGEELVLVSYDPFEGLGVTSPYRSASPIFLHRTDCANKLDPAAIPEQLARRQLSLRTFDGAAAMIDGRVVDGRELGPALEQLVGLPGAERIHIHNAGPGCFAAVARSTRPSAVLRA